jgi:hypothetical protein
VLSWADCACARAGCDVREYPDCAELAKVQTRQDTLGAARVGQSAQGLCLNSVLDRVSPVSCVGAELIYWAG